MRNFCKSLKSELKGNYLIPGCLKSTCKSHNMEWNGKDFIHGTAAPARVVQFCSNAQRRDTICPNIGELIRLLDKVYKEVENPTP